MSLLDNITTFKCPDCGKVIDRRGPPHVCPPKPKEKAPPEPDEYIDHEDH